MLALVVLVTGCGASSEVSSETTPAASQAPAVEPTPEVSEPAPSTPADASETDTGLPAGAVHVLLSEWIVEPDPTSAPAGEVTFQADDQGGEEHEMVVVRADDAADLPTDEDGAVDEDKIAEDDFVGEVEELEPGTTDEATFNLEPGTYVLFCNITEEQDGEVESHFANGMHSTFTVSG